MQWLARFDDTGRWTPLWLGVGITIGFLLVRSVFDAFFVATWGFPQGFYPLWQSAEWWTEIVNASLIGYIPAALVIARRGIDRDLTQLRTRLSCSDAEAGELRAAATGPPALAGKSFILIGLAYGITLIFLDPVIRGGAPPSPSHPTFLWVMVRIPLFVWLVCVLVTSDLKATRAYFRAGRDLVEVDLLDVQSLSPFARRGLRSALIWVLFTIVFSLYWLGDLAAQQNLPFVIAVLGMASVAFFVPLLGVHYNIASVKRLELDRLRDEIREERKAIIDKPPNGQQANPRLANLIAYYQLIDRTREWPIDAANVLRFFLYLLLGLGSWLGGAVVERLLDTTLSS